MPLYDFINTETDEVFEKFMSISAMEEYLKENPSIQRYLGNQTNASVDSVRIGVKKNDSGWKDVLQQIHARTPGSTLDKVAKI